jgi:hypothetical protein
MVHIGRRSAYSLALAYVAAASMAATPEPATPPVVAVPSDPWVPFICDDGRPAAVDPGSYGMQLDDSFRHPHATPVDEENPHPFPGRAEAYDTASYASGIRVEASYEGADFTPGPFHTWQNIVDFKGRRYLFQYDRSDGRVYDITDVRNLKVVQKLGREDIEAPWGVNKETLPGRDWAAHDFWGASSIQWNAQRGEYIMVQSFEQKRQIGEVSPEPPGYKFSNPAGVAGSRSMRCAVRANRTGSCWPP